MTTVDIKTNYGAKGDGQKITALVTTTLGSKNVWVVSNIFSSGDVGKYICIGTQGGTNIYDTIATAGVPDAQHCTLTNNATVAFAGTSQTVEWGTNDKPAFAAFNADFTGIGATGVVLNIPDGRYCIAGTGASLGFGFGIKGLTVVGASATGAIVSDMLGSGSGVFFGGCDTGQFNDNLHDARTLPVSLGSTSIVLANITKASLFSTNTYALMTGVDTQGDGFPSSQYFYEYVYITGISGATLTTRDPLQNIYKITWPLFFAGNSGAVDLGGPATIYALESGWDTDQEYIDLVSDQFLQPNSVGRNIVFTRGSSSGFGVFPTVSMNWSATNYVQTDRISEFDKLTKSVTVTGGHFRSIKIQSASPDIATFTNVILDTKLDGTPKSIILNGCTIPEFAPGPVTEGCTNQITANNCSISLIDSRGSGEFDIFGAGAYSFSNGIFTRLKSGGSGAPPQWGTPGGYVLISGSGATVYYGMFKVLDIYEDGTNIYVVTNLASDAFSNFPTSGNLYSFGAHPCPALTWTNNSGCDNALAWNNCPPGNPMYSYWGLTYSGNIGTGQSTIPMVGTLVSASINVTKAFTGTGALSLNFDGPFVRLNGAIVPWTPSVNLKVAGERIVTPTAVTNPQSGDSLTAPGAIWLFVNQITPKATADIGGQDPSTYPSVTITLNTNQGLLPTAVTPLRMRLHA